MEPLGCAEINLETKLTLTGVRVELIFTEVKSKDPLDYHMVTSRREWIPLQDCGAAGIVRKLKSPSKLSSNTWNLSEQTEIGVRETFRLAR